MISQFADNGLGDSTEDDGYGGGHGLGRGTGYANGYANGDGYGNGYENSRGDGTGVSPTVHFRHPWTRLLLQTDTTFDCALINAMIRAEAA